MTCLNLIEIMHVKLLKQYMKQGVVAHTCDPSYSEDEVEGSRSKAGPGKITRPYLKNKLKKKDWEHGSRGRAFA
jgi:hypothetical protein